jgi:hypothetical protein
MGKKICYLIPDWYFPKTQHTVRLVKTLGTGVAGFYRKTGSRETGENGKDEI